MRPLQGVPEVRAFDGAPRGDRLHVRVRWSTCPFAAIEREVPRAGRILDLGSGHGLATLLLARTSGERSIVALDPDRHKLDLLTQAAATLGVADQVHVSTGTALPAGPFDAVVIVDVLYLLDAAAQRHVIAEVAALLRPGGRVVIKELERRASARYAFARAQEEISVRALQITQGDAIAIPSRDELVAAVEAAGLHTSWSRLDRRQLHPHQMVVGTRRG